MLNLHFWRFLDNKAIYKFDKIQFW